MESNVRESANGVEIFFELTKSDFDTKTFFDGAVEAYQEGIQLESWVDEYFSDNPAARKKLKAFTLITSIGRNKQFYRVAQDTDRWLANKYNAYLKERS